MRKPKIKEVERLVQKIGREGVCPHIPTFKAIKVDIDIRGIGRMEYINEEGNLVCENGHYYELEF